MAQHAKYNATWLAKTRTNVHYELLYKTRKWLKTMTWSGSDNRKCEVSSIQLVKKLVEYNSSTWEYSRTRVSRTITWNLMCSGLFAFHWIAVENFTTEN